MCHLLSLLSFLILIFSPTFSYLANGADPVLYPANGHYYQLVEVYPGLNWYEAKAAAEALDHNRMPGYLATITTSQEQDFVVSSFPQILPNYVWLGNSDEELEGWWRWITGESAGWGIGRNGMYANWHPGEPNGGTSENCLDFADGSTQWNDESCDRQLNFFLVEYSAPILYTAYRPDKSGQGPVDPNSDVYGVKVGFELVRKIEIWPDVWVCGGPIDEMLFGDTVVGFFEAPKYFTATRATHPNFDDFIEALKDGQHCVCISSDVVDTAEDVVFEGYTDCYSEPDLTGVEVGSIELLVGDGIEFYFEWNESCPCWVFYYDEDYYVTIYEELPKLVVEIDIKPGSYPNSINLKSKGKVPVAILTTDNFDARDVDPDSVDFAGANLLRWRMEDVDNDIDDDMLFHFKTSELDLTKESTEVTLEGETIDGVQITGTDSVKIVPKYKWHGKKIKWHSKNGKWYNKKSKKHLKKDKKGK